MVKAHRAVLVLLSGSILLLSPHGGVVRARPAHAVGARSGGPAFLFPAALRGLDFLENRGQWDTSARFVARRGDLAVILQDRAIHVHHAQAPGRPVRLTFEGASPAAVPGGENPRAGRYHFYSGPDRAAWRAQVPAFASVLYRGLYPGVEMRVREEDGRLEYDLLLEPHADLDQVRIHCAGVENIELAHDGALIMETVAGPLRQTPPRTWELLPGGQRRRVDSRFRVIDGQRYGFVAPDRDRSLALVVDPGVEWATYLGGSASEQLTAVALARDGTGDVLVAGYMNSPDFPLFSDHDFTPFQNRVFIARLDGTGSILRWAALLGGWSSQVIYRGLAAAPGGDAALAGETNSPDFPTTPGALDRTGSFKDAFVARFDPNGELIFSTFLGGTGIDQAYAVSFDAAENVIVGGNTTSANFPTTPGAFDTTYAVPSDASQGDAHGDIFITRLTPDGSGISYSTLIGGRSADVLEDMEVAPSGLVTLVGWITGHNVQVFPTTADAFDRTWNGNQDAILARVGLNGTGQADLVYSTLLGGANQDNLFGVALDPVNPDRVTVSGMTWSDDFPVTPGVFKTTNPRFSALFESQAGILARFDLPVTGPRARVWSTYVGPPGSAANIEATDVVVTSAGEPIVVGLMGDRRWPTTRGAFDRTPEGTGSGSGGGEFLARFSADATQLVYSSYIGGSGGNTDQFWISPRLAYAGSNSVVVAGTTESADFPVSAGAFDTTPGSPQYGADGFAMRFTAEPDASGDLTVGAPTLLSPPSGTSAPSGTWHVRLQWDEVLDAAGIDGYQFETSTQPTFPEGMVSYAGTAHGTEVILPPTGTGEQGLALSTWHWRVRAVDRAGNVGAWSAASSFTLNAAGAPPGVFFVDTFPRIVAGGGSAVGVVHLDRPAPAGGLIVSLATRYNENSGFLAPHLPIPLTIPASVTLPAGATSAQFDIATTPVPGAVGVDLLATVGGIGRTAIVTVHAAAPSIDPTGLVIRPASVIGGTPSTGTVTLEAPAPQGGLVVSLATSHGQAARVPASVTVPAGATSASFPITTFPVAFDIDSYVDAFTTSGLSRQYIFVKPAGASRLTSFTLSPSSGTGGTLVTGTVGFSSPVSPAAWPASDGAYVSLETSDPTVVGLPPFVNVPSGATSATFSFSARSTPTSEVVNLTASHDTVTLTAPLAVSAGPPVTLSSVGLNVTTVSSGQGGIASAILSAPAPPGGITVRFTASPGVIYFTSAQDSFVSAGSTGAAAAFIANPVASTTPVTIAASYGTSSASTTLTVNRAVTNFVRSVALSPTSVNGGSPATGTVTIDGPAPSGGAAIRLFSSSSVASVPSTVVVPSGATSASFTVTTTSGSATTTATISASLNIMMSAALTVNSTAPPPTPSAPTLLSPAHQATVSQPITFDWTDAANAATYNIQIDNSNNFTTPLTLSQNVSVSQATITGLPAQQLWWRVRGINSAGVAGPFSASRRFNALSAPAVASLSALSVNPTSVVGGNTSTGTVTLTSAAPSGGAVVALSDNSTAVTVPASVTVPAGSTSASFTVTTSTVTTSTTATLTATYNSVNRTASLTVTPQPPSASLSALSVNPTSVVGGNTAQGTVTLTSAAPAGGAVVSLSSSSGSASVPASVTVPAGSTSASFTVTTSTVTTSTTATLTATHNAVSRTATLTVNPPPPAASLSALSVNPTSVVGGNTSQGTVTLTSAAPSGGAVVALSDNSSSASAPASVTVAAGATSATFMVTTSTVTTSATATLTATYNAVSRTATLTINPAPAGPLQAPSLISPSNDARFDPGQNIVFDWTDVSGAASYTIQIDDDDEFPTPHIVSQTVSVSTFSSSTLPTRTMWFRVRANDSAGNPGNWSSIRRFEVKD